MAYAVGGVYVNDLTEDEMTDRDRVVEAYGMNYDRLSQIKALYDPGNFFHLNANVRPAATAGADR